MAWDGAGLLNLLVGGGKGAGKGKDRPKPWSFWPDKTLDFRNPRARHANEMRDDVDAKRAAVFAICSDLYDVNIGLQQERVRPCWLMCGSNVRLSEGWFHELEDVLDGAFSRDHQFAVLQAIKNVNAHYRVQPCSIRQWCHERRAEAMSYSGAGVYHMHDFDPSTHFDYGQSYYGQPQTSDSALHRAHHAGAGNVTSGHQVPSNIGRDNHGSVGASHGNSHGNLSGNLGKAGSVGPGMAAFTAAGGNGTNNDGGQRRAMSVDAAVLRPFLSVPPTCDAAAVDGAVTSLVASFNAVGDAGKRPGTPRSGNPRDKQKARGSNE